MKTHRLWLAAVVLMLMSATTAMAVTHTVNQVGLTFQPDDLTIEIGDTVEWNWSTGSHTVTSGLGNGDPNAGNLFDAPLNMQ